MDTERRVLHRSSQLVVARVSRLEDFRCLGAFAPLAVVVVVVVVVVVGCCGSSGFED